MRFVAIDVETANPDMASICQVGLVRFENGVEVAAESIYIDPEDYFDSINISIHGIDEETVAGAKTFAGAHPWLTGWLQEEIVVSHTHFDRVSIAQASRRDALADIKCQWLDSARVCRRAWPDSFARSGYGLDNVTAELGIPLEHHHDALCDARAAGHVLLAAVQHSGIAMNEWLDLVHKPIGSPDGYRRTGDGDGALVGQTIVFTGALEITRSEAADKAAAAGANVLPAVRKDVTMLVVGNRDFRPGWTEKSRKHLRAEHLIEQGHDIRIVGETDFLALAAVTE